RIAGGAGDVLWSIRDRDPWAGFPNLDTNAESAGGEPDWATHGNVAVDASVGVHVPDRTDAARGAIGNLSCRRALLCGHLAKRVPQGHWSRPASGAGARARPVRNDYRRALRSLIPQDAYLGISHAGTPTPDADQGAYPSLSRSARAILAHRATHHPDADFRLR